MGRSEDSSSSDFYPITSLGDSPNDWELPEHTATLGAFALDRFEVTVGRFRKFVSAYTTWHDQRQKPRPNDGASGTGTGWSAAWDSLLPSDATALATAVSQTNCANATWTSTVGNNESSPINCVSWYIAFAFCVWDSGRLPTEAEWEYAAAGGAENRLFPWGGNVPTSARANYKGALDASPDMVVGSKPLGMGYFGHLDLAGSMQEWTLDYYDQYSSVPCTDCAVLPPSNADFTTVMRVTRGGSWDYPGTELGTGDWALRAAQRNHYQAKNGAAAGIGFRCARPVPPAH
jgi:formylglycine-generating enzyme required for sulfatase activity